MLLNRPPDPSGPRPVARFVLFALGEVALVVVGILLAVQIDGWIRDRQDARMAREYMVRIRADLERDTAAMRAKMRDIELSRAALDSLRAILAGEGPAQLTEDWLSVGLLYVFDFVPETSTFEELKAAGVFGVLPAEFAGRLVGYHNFLDNVVLSNTEGPTAYSRGVVGPHLYARYPLFFQAPGETPTGDPALFSVPAERLRQDMVLGNAVRFRGLVMDLMATGYADGLRQAEALLQTLEVDGAPGAAGPS